MLAVMKKAGSRKARADANGVNGCLNFGTAVPAGGLLGVAFAKCEVVPG